MRPWPLLVTLGADDEGAERVVDLESLGLLAVDGGHDLVTAVLAAMALELACSPWTDDLRLTLVGDDRLSPAPGAAQREDRGRPGRPARPARAHRPRPSG